MGWAKHRCKLIGVFRRGTLLAKLVDTGFHGIYTETTAVNSFRKALQLLYNYKLALPLDSKGKVRTTVPAATNRAPLT